MTCPECGIEVPVIGESQVHVGTLRFHKKCWVPWLERMLRHYKPKVDV